MESLLSVVKKDIHSFLKQNNEILFNERDFQMHLALWLKESTSNYDDVDVEYYVPHNELNDYVWESELRLDIVVKKDCEYLPVEIKYKTKKVESKIERFGEMLQQNVTVIKNQSAQDIGRYSFWKDIKRLEQVCERFNNVKNAIAVFLTNDDSYTKESSLTSNCFHFNMNEGFHSTKKQWLNLETTCAKQYKGFELTKEYCINWHIKEIKEIKFHYCIVEI